MKCAKVCNDCQLQCDSCFKHCLTLLDDGKKEYAKLAQLCADCAECCKTCSTLRPPEPTHPPHAGVLREVL